MPSTIYRNFRQIADAEGARSALLAEGFANSAVQLNLHEARSLSTSTSAVQNIMDSLTPDDVDNTDKPNRPAALLSVDVDDDVQREQADRIMAGFGAQEA